MMWIALVGLFGLMIGSFLNVVILRLPIMLQAEWEDDCRQCLHIASDKIDSPYNLIYPPSHCPYCKKKLGILENIPLLSFIFLKGKCKNCQHPISWRYPFIELLTAIFSMITAYHFGLSYFLIGPLLLTWYLIALAMIDFDHKILPDHLTLPLLWAGLLFNLLTEWVPLQEAVLGAVLGYVFLWTVYWLFKALTKKEGMGYGDFKLLAALGAWFGWKSLPFILLGASAAGAIIGIFGIIIMKRSRSVPIPFGPFLTLAGWIYLVWGDKIIHYYLSLNTLS